MLAVAEIFGHKIPPVGTSVVVVIAIVLFFLLSRNGGLDGGGGGRGGRVGRGRVVQCTRCGRNYQPQQVELMASGDVRNYYDDRCPNCGWDLDWGNADKKGPGGASGGW